MIARDLRLRRPFEFERARRRGRSWTTPLVVMSLLPNDREHNRYGFAVGRRVGNAVRRNLIKRRLREAVRHRHPEIRQGFDLVFIARGTLANPDVSFTDVQAAIDTLLNRARLLTDADDQPVAHSTKA